MFTFTVLLAFLVVVSAKPSPRQAPCESPKAWEGDEFLEVDSQNVTMLTMKASYDEDNKRVRVLLQNDPAKREYIILYNERRIYSIVGSTGKCTVSTYDQSFIPAQVPKSATMAAEGYVGLKSQGLKYKAYYGTFAKESNNGFYVISVVEPYCVIVYSKGSNKGIVIRVSLSNIVLGIADPSIFTPPKSCEEGPVPDLFKAHPRY